MKVLDDEFLAYLEAKTTFKEDAVKLSDPATLEKQTKQGSVNVDVVDSVGVNWGLEARAQTIFMRMDPTDPTDTDLGIAKKLDSLGSPGAHEFLERVDAHSRWKSKKSPVTELKEDIQSLLHF